MALCLLTIAEKVLFDLHYASTIKLVEAFSRQDPTVRVYYLHKKPINTGELRWIFYKDKVYYYLVLEGGDVCAATFYQLSSVHFENLIYVAKLIDYLGNYLTSDLDGGYFVDKAIEIYRNRYLKDKENLPIKNWYNKPQEFKVTSVVEAYRILWERKDHPALVEIAKLVIKKCKPERQSTSLIIFQTRNNVKLEQLRTRPYRETENFQYWPFIKLEPWHLTQYPLIRLPSGHMRMWR